MIKFFRKIRQKMLTENKISKYLIYAIGEVLLVVIGIMIAISINTWHQNNQNNKKVHAYFERIIIDLNNDLKASYSLRKNYSTVNEIALELDRMQHVDYNTDSLYAHLKDWYRYTKDFTPNNSTISEMLSTGNIDLISNKELKSQLLELYNVTYPEFLFILDRSNNNQTTIRIEYFSQLLSWVDIFNNLGPGTVGTGIDRPKKELKWLRDKKSNEFLQIENVLALAYATYSSGLVSLETLISKQKLVIENIEKEIGNK